MGDGWRNRFLAPVYALGISFLFVFVIGFAFGSTSTVIRFKTPQPEQPGTPVFGSLLIVVFAAEKNDVIVASMRDGPGEFRFPSPDGDFRVCLDVPPGWVTSHTQTGKIGDLECLSVTNDDDINVVFSEK